jgi:UDP-N-acetylmuramoylalanine--D-glutamate ligase
MKRRPPLPGGPYVVVGLARSGVAAALALRARGEEVIGSDAGARTDPALSAAAERLSEAGVEIHLDASDDAIAALSEARALVKSPGVPASAPIVAAARARGIPVLGEVELAWRLLENEFVAVTGTNGKTTTTEWIGHIHREAGLPVEVAGNVGTAATSLIGTTPAEATIVCEVSSFQLEDTLAFAPEVAVLLNLAPDHLDRYDSYDGYVAAKMRIFANQGPADFAVTPTELTIGAGDARRVRFGDGRDADLSSTDGHLTWRGEPLISSAEISLPGEHNRANAMAAAAACLARGVEREAVARGLRTFAGVAHRLELVRTLRGVAYVNDSKATNVDSTIVALRTYTGGVHLIAGGRGKHQDFSPLAPLVAERCAAVYLVGEAQPQIAGALGHAGVPVHRLDRLEPALLAAAAAAQPGDTVLLSPACASYDQYKDFEARGAHFRALVEAL